MELHPPPKKMEKLEKPDVQAEAQGTASHNYLVYHLRTHRREGRRKRRGERGPGPPPASPPCTWSGSDIVLCEQWMLSPYWVP